MRRGILRSALLTAASSYALAQTAVDLRTQTKSVDFSGANYSKPFKAGSALPGTCSTGETFFKITAPPGANLYLCGPGGVWSLQGTGFTSVETPFSVTPTFDLGASGSVDRFEIKLTGDVISSSFANLKAGAKFSVEVLQDAAGGRRMAWPAAALNTCVIAAGANAATTQQFEVASDGLTVLGVGCTTNEAGVVFSGPVASSCASAPPAGTLCAWFDQAANTLKVKDAAGNVRAAVLGVSGSPAHQALLYIDGDGRQHTAQLATADLADGASIEKTSAKGQADGYASLDSGARVPVAQLPTGQTAGSVALGNDARFSDARTPVSHAASHRNGGGDEIGSATPGAFAIPKAGASGALDSGWLPPPSASTLGGVQSADCSSVGHVARINANGSVTCSADASARPAVVYTADHTQTADDCGRLVVMNGASATLWLANPAVANCGFHVLNLNATALTVAGGSATINGSAAATTVAALNGAWIATDAAGTNYNALLPPAAGSGLTASTSGPGTVWKAQQAVNPQTGSSYTVADADRAKLVTFGNSGGTAVALPQAGAGGQFAAGWFADFQNRGAAAATITPAAGTIDGAATLTLSQNQGARVVSDGANYYTQRGAAPGGGGGSSYYQTVQEHGAAQTQQPAANFRDGFAASLVGGVTTIDATPRDARIITLRDEFGSGTTSTGNIGQTAWNFDGIGASGTVSSTWNSTWPNLGITRTGCAAGNANCGIALHHGTSTTPNNSFGALASNTAWGATVVFKLEQTTNTRARIGFANVCNTAAPGSGWFLRYDTNAGDANWTYENRVVGTATTLNTGIPADTGFHTVDIYSTVAGTIHIALDGGTDKTICASGCDIAAAPSAMSMDSCLVVATDTNSSAAWAQWDLWAFSARANTLETNKRN